MLVVVSSKYIPWVHFSKFFEQHQYIPANLDYFELLVQPLEIWQLFLLFYKMDNNLYARDLILDILGFDSDSLHLLQAEMLS